MSCEERALEGRSRPEIVEAFPERGLAGYVTELRLTIRHLPAETVLPADLQLNTGGVEASALAASHFHLPKPGSETKPSVTRKEEGDRVTTELVLPLVPLPPEAGRAELTLPPLPVAVARASGQLDTFCTQPHAITIEDPLVNQPNAELEPDPPPRPQREIWTAARDVTTGALLALPLLALLIWGLYRAWPHLKKKPAPPPPLPPWEMALRALAALEREGHLERHEYESFLDRVSDTLRAYLGERYGAGGLEATTRETLRLLGERAPGFEFEREVRAILQRADLVKFARKIPDEAECREAFAETRRIVQKTMPTPSLDPRGPAPQAGGRS